MLSLFFPKVCHSSGSIPAVVPEQFVVGSTCSYKITNFVTTHTPSLLHLQYIATCIHPGSYNVNNSTCHLLDMLAASVTTVSLDFPYPGPLWTKYWCPLAVVILYQINFFLHFSLSLLGAYLAPSCGTGRPLPELPIGLCTRSTLTTFSLYR